MHWLTFIFGFLAIYCGAGFIYSLSTAGASDAHNALVMFGVGAVVFALASFINQKRHAHAKSNAVRGTENLVDRSGE